MPGYQNSVLGPKPVGSALVPSYPTRSSTHAPPALCFFLPPGRDGTVPAFILKGAAGHFRFVVSPGLTQLVKQWPHRREVKLSILQVIKAPSHCQRPLVADLSTRLAALSPPGARGQVLLFMFLLLPALGWE